MDADEEKEERPDGGAAGGAGRSREGLSLEPRPLSDNRLAAFFQRIFRRWMQVWSGFKVRRPRLANAVYLVFFFLVFSIGVTIWQYVVMTFLPYAFGYRTGEGVEWGWAPFSLTLGGESYGVVVFGDANGWQYFAALEIAVFTAQCINFPLQRNITYRSHGNPWFQAMWYFIGWVAVSVVINVLWGVINCFFTHWGWYDSSGLEALAGLVKTLLTGVVSMVVFFFVFLVIFPDCDKTERSKAARAERLRRAADADPGNAGRRAAAEKAEAEAEKATRIRIRFHSEKAISEAKNLADAAINAHLAAQRALSSGAICAEAAKRAEDEAYEAVAAREETYEREYAALEAIGVSPRHGRGGKTAE